MWTTLHELELIEYWMMRKQTSTLEGYLAGLRLRVRWGAIDPNEVFAAVLSALERLK